MSRRDDADSVTVTGPGCEGRTAPNDSAGMSLALYLATKAAGDVTFYVRQGERVVATVERDHRSIVTRRVAS